MADEVETVESPTPQNLSEELAISPSLKKLIDSQGIKPVQDISVFAGLIPDDEIDSFVSEVYQARMKP